MAKKYRENTCDFATCGGLLRVLNFLESLKHQVEVGLQIVAYRREVSSAHEQILYPDLYEWWENVFMGRVSTVNIDFIGCDLFENILCLHHHGCKTHDLSLVKRCATVELGQLVRVGVAWNLLTLYRHLLKISLNT